MLNRNSLSSVLLMTMNQVMKVYRVNIDDQKAIVKE